MSSNEGSAQTLQPRDEPTASATTANSAKAANWWIWARLVAVVVFIVLALAVFFAAGFFTGSHYGGGYREDFLVPGEQAPSPGGHQCIQTFCQPAGRYGQQCAQHWVNCPG
jgi:hypothetical protein